MDDHQEQPPAVVQYQPVQPVMMVAARKTNGCAVASLVLSLLWIFWFGSLVGLILGIVGMSQIKKSGDTEGGYGLAVAGTIISGVSLIPGVFFFITVIVAAAGSGS